MGHGNMADVRQPGGVRAGDSADERRHTASQADAMRGVQPHHVRACWQWADRQARQMTVKTAFIVGDLLTLLASCQKYPEGFVGVGPRPRDMYCVEKVMDNQSDALKKLR